MELTGIGVGGSGGAEEGRVKDVMLEGVGHLIPMIVPAMCAEKACDWLDAEAGRWWEEEERWKRGWLGKTRQERTMIGEEWKERIGGDPRLDRRSEKL